MAYQTRNRKQADAPVVTESHQPPIMHEPQQQAEVAAIVAPPAANYLTTTVNEFAKAQQQQAEQLQQQLEPPVEKMDDDTAYEDILEEGVKTEESDKEKNLPKWLKKRKENGQKISKKAKRKKMNAKLRRLLQPKNAIMVLNELKESVKFAFLDQPCTKYPNKYFIATVEVDGQTFKGQAQIKTLAKQNAAENALKALLLEKMSQSSVNFNAEGDVAMKEDQPADLGPPGTDVPPGEEPPLLDEEGKPVGNRSNKPSEDDVPWGSLASFALFKLFNDWHSIGVTRPPSIRPGRNADEIRGPSPMKKIPDNPTNRHPVMLLNQLRPALTFSDAVPQGVSPNVMFTVTVTIDGVVYQGMGKSKKNAKREAAKSALMTIFNIQYND